MILAAVHTTTTTFGLWVIVVVAVTCLAFWLTMTVLVANRNPRRGTGRSPGPPASRMMGGPAEPGTAATTETAVTRDDMPRVPQQRQDADRAEREAAAAGRRHPR